MSKADITDGGGLVLDFGFEVDGLGGCSEAEGDDGGSWPCVEVKGVEERSVGFVFDILVCVCESCGSKIGKFGLDCSYLGWCFCRYFGDQKMD